MHNVLLCILYNLCILYKIHLSILYLDIQLYMYDCIGLDTIRHLLPANLLLAWDLSRGKLMKIRIILRNWIYYLNPKLTILVSCSKITYNDVKHQKKDSLISVMFFPVGGHESWVPLLTSHPAGSRVPTRIVYFMLCPPAVSPAPDHSPALAAVKAIVRNTD